MTTLRLTDGSRAAEAIDTDILVVGAGPAGLATAITAARHGVRVVRRSLAEDPLAVVPLGFPNLREALRASPELPALCPQDLIE